MTIKEIAQLAGVSSAAVSRYLNGGYVSEEKKEQIRKVIEATGYQPSAQARMLRTKKASLVGVVVPKDQFRIHQPDHGRYRERPCRKRLSNASCRNRQHTSKGNGISPSL